MNIDVKTMKTGFWHMPKTFYAVLFIEFWERFAFYGLQAIAVIYFVQRFGILEADSDGLFSSFSALLYAMLTVGGIIGDKVLGLRRTYLLGIVFLILGYGVVSFANDLSMLYSGMGIVLVGNVFFKTNATNYVGICFESNDPRLDSAYTYFYMSINVGSFLSMILVPLVTQAVGGSIGLSLCAIGMVVALGSYFVFRERFVLSDNYVGKNRKNMWLKLIFIAIIGLIIAYIFAWLLHDLQLSKLVLYFVAVVTLIVYLIIASKLNKNEAKGMYVALILLLQAVVFWVMYMQTSTSITLFALHNVRLTLLGYPIPAGLTQSFNGFFLIIFSPILANWYIARHKKDKHVGIPAKFVAGIFITGLCFIVLGIAGSFFADGNAQVSIIWMLVAYALYSLGELLVSAIGISMMAQLLPKRLGGFAQGIWFLSSAIGMKIGGQLSSNAAVGHVTGTDNFAILHSYISLFFELGVVTCIIAVVFLIILKPLARAMQQVLEHRY